MLHINDNKLKNQLYHAILTNQINLDFYIELSWKHWRWNDGKFYDGTFETLFVFIRKLRKIKENYNHIILFTLYFVLQSTIYFQEKKINKKGRSKIARDILAQSSKIPRTIESSNAL